jgi:hypothetical protein
MPRRRRIGGAPKRTISAPPRDAKTVQRDSREEIDKTNEVDMQYH